MSTTRQIDADTATEIFELIRSLHVDAASKCVGRGDTNGALAVADNWDGLLVKFGVK